MSVVVWPHEALPARPVAANVVPFSRSGGRSLGGLEPVTRTDRGYWRITLGDVMLHTPAQRRLWNAIRVSLGGRAGLISVPVWSHDSAPWPGGDRLFPLSVPHSDGSRHSDGAGYRQRRVSVRMADTVRIGDTVCRLQVVDAAMDLTGVRFSYNGALYEAGPARLVSVPHWTVPIFPAARTAIPGGAELELDMPRCICRLVDDRGMDHPLDVSLINAVSVEFVEAVDYWSDLASGPVRRASASIITPVVVPAAIAPNLTSVVVSPPSGGVGDLFSVSFTASLGRPAADVSYRWLLNSEEIPGAVSQTYLAAEPGVLAAVVDLRNAAGQSAGEAQAVVVVASTDTPPLFITPPLISGTGEVGVAIKLTMPGTWSGSPEPTHAIAWRKDGVDIPGETGTSYLPVLGDIGADISAEVTVTNTAGDDVASSNVVTVVAASTAPAYIAATQRATEVAADGMFHNDVAGVRVGDLLLYAGFAHNSSATPPLPSGHVAIGESSGFSSSARLSRRIATAADVGAIWAPLGTTRANMAVIRNFDPANPIGGFSGFAVTNDTTPAWNALTVTGADGLVIAARGIRGSRPLQVYPGMQVLEEFGGQNFSLQAAVTGTEPYTTVPTGSLAAYVEPALPGLSAGAHTALVKINAGSGTGGGGDPDPDEGGGFANVDIDPTDYLDVLAAPITGDTRYRAAPGTYPEFFFPRDNTRHRIILTSADPDNQAVFRGISLGKSNNVKGNYIHIADAPAGNSIRNLTIEWVKVYAQQFSTAVPQGGGPSKSILLHGEPLGWRVSGTSHPSGDLAGYSQNGGMIGIDINGSGIRGLTLRNVTFRGYAIQVSAGSSQGTTIEHCDMTEGHEDYIKHGGAVDLVVRFNRIGLRHRPIDDPAVAAVLGWTRDEPPHGDGIQQMSPSVGVTFENNVTGPDASYTLHGGLFRNAQASGQSERVKIVNNLSYTTHETGYLIDDVKHDGGSGIDGGGFDLIVARNKVTTFGNPKAISGPTITIGKDSVVGARVYYHDNVSARVYPEPQSAPSGWDEGGNIRTNDESVMPPGWVEIEEDKVAIGQPFAGVGGAR